MAVSSEEDEPDCGQPQAFAHLDQEDVSWDPQLRNRKERSLRKQCEKWGLILGICPGAIAAIVFLAMDTADSFFWMFTGGGVAGGVGEMCGTMVAVTLIGTRGWNWRGAMLGMLLGAIRAGKRGGLGGMFGGSIILGFGLLAKIVNAWMPLMLKDFPWKDLPTGAIYRYGLIILGATAAGILGALLGSMIGGIGRAQTGTILLRLGGARRGSTVGVLAGLAGVVLGAWLTVMAIGAKTHWPQGEAVMIACFLYSVMAILLVLCLVAGALVGAMIGAVLAALGGACAGGIVGAVGGYERS